MTFTARVITGSGRGKQLHVPTINLAMDDVPEGLDNALYACRVNGNLAGVLHYGIRPTFNDTPSCEVHIIGEVVEVPPEELTIAILEKIRDTIAFTSAEELMEQMQKDIAAAHDILGTS